MPAESTILYLFGGLITNSISPTNKIFTNQNPKHNGDASESVIHLISFFRPLDPALSNHWKVTQWSNPSSDRWRVSLPWRITQQKMPPFLSPRQITKQERENSRRIKISTRLRFHFALNQIQVSHPPLTIVAHLSTCLFLFPNWFGELKLHFKKRG